MPRRGLTPEVALAVHLSAICSRNRYTRDPAPVLAELFSAAGDRLDILAAECGCWAGYFDDPDTHALCAALLREISGAGEWVALGRQRRSAGVHGAGGPGASSGSSAAL